MRRNILLTIALGLFSSAFADMRVIEFKPDQIAVGEAGGTSVVFIGSNSEVSGLPNGNCHEWGRTYFYLPVGDPKAKHFEALALTAQSTGQSLLVYYDDSRPQIVMQWIGQTGCLLENMRIQ